MIRNSSNESSLVWANLPLLGFLPKMLFLGPISQIINIDENPEIPEVFTKITLPCSRHPSAPSKVSQFRGWHYSQPQYSSCQVNHGHSQLFILVSEPSWVKKCKNFTFLVITEPFFNLQWSVIPPMNDLSLRSNFPYRFFFKEIKNFAFFS